MGVCVHVFLNSSERLICTENTSDKQLRNSSDSSQSFLLRAFFKAEYRNETQILPFKSISSSMWSMKLRGFVLAGKQIYFCAVFVRSVNHKMNILSTAWSLDERKHGCCEANFRTRGYLIRQWTGVSWSCVKWWLMAGCFVWLSTWFIRWVPGQASPPPTPTPPYAMYLDQK